MCLSNHLKKTICKNASKKDIHGKTPREMIVKKKEKRMKTNSHKDFQIRPLRYIHSQTKTYWAESNVLQLLSRNVTTINIY